jgi:hypothetical protein
MMDQGSSDELGFEIGEGISSAYWETMLRRRVLRERRRRLVEVVEACCLVSQKPYFKC